MAFRTSGQLQLLSLLLGLSSMDRSGAGAQEFQLLQPQITVSVSPGENLTLTCAVTGNATAGPVKWFKGSGSGRQLVYADTESLPRVTRAVNGSDTNYTIRISDTRPEDTGIYHCVKFRKGSGADEEFRSGAGTTVSVGGRSPGTARSQTPFPDTTRAQSQPGANKDSDVLYADLQHSAEPQQPKKSVPAEHSEYAAVKVTQAIAR